MRKPEPIHRKDKKCGQYVLDSKGQRRIYGYQVRAPKPGGGMRYRKFATKHEALAFAVRLEIDRSGGLTFDLGRRFEEAVPEFLREHCVGLKPSAKADYERNLRRAAQYLTGRRLADISVKTLREMRDAIMTASRTTQGRIVSAALAKAEVRNDAAEIARLKARAAAAEGAGARTANKVLGTMLTFLKHCKREGYVAVNVAEDVRRAKVPKPAYSDAVQDAVVFSPAEIARAVTATDPNWHAAMQVLFFGGLRIGEALGLAWGDVELNAGRVLVRRQLCGMTGELRAPKTKAGIRFVELPPFVITALREWKLACPKGALNLVFPNADGCPMDQHNFANRVFHPALRRAGLRRIRVHDTRHTCASLLIGTGADIASISRQLGHANVAITLSTYTHWFARRAESGLGARLAALLEAETDGCALVAPPTAPARKHRKIGYIRAADSGIMSPLH